MSKKVHENPFRNLQISKDEELSSLNVRYTCAKCHKSRKFFCYTCALANPDTKIPQIRLPVKIDIVKHIKETDGKSTSSHAVMIAPEDVNIYIYPDIPDYTQEEGVILIFPSSKSITIQSMFKGYSTFDIQNNYGLEKGFHIGTILTKFVNDVISDEDKLVLATDDEGDHIQYTLENLPFKKAVVIDSTWNQCRSIYKDERINTLKSVIIQNRATNFWRHQKGSPRWFLATVECIHQFLLEVHISAWGVEQNYLNKCLIGDLKLNTAFVPRSKIITDLSEYTETDPRCKPYNGQYDNLLYFFSFMYSLIHTEYDHENLLSYKRPF
ncbi:unnamed protein product [Diamesa tonsa]